MQNHLAPPLMLCACLSVVTPISLFLANCHTEGGCTVRLTMPAFSAIEPSHATDEPPSSSNGIMFTTTTTAYATGGASPQRSSTTWAGFGTTVSVL